MLSPVRAPGLHGALLRRQVRSQPHEHRRAQAIAFRPVAILHSRNEAQFYPLDASLLALVGPPMELSGWRSFSSRANTLFWVS